MTNTNDFRRYAYQYDTSYLISGFDVTRSSAAPKRRPVEQPEVKEEERDFKLHNNVNVKHTSVIKYEEVQARKKMAVTLLVAFTAFVLIASTLFSFAYKNQLTREIADVQTDISYAQSENISLQSRLDAMVSISMIDDYAVNKLGMTKMKSNQIQYMDVSEYKTKRTAQTQKQTPKKANTTQAGNK